VGGIEWALMSGKPRLNLKGCSAKDGDEEEERKGKKKK